ncbi:DUF6461 domain-containing protein [Streptomyces sp. NPDC005077]|uniref:DUF6461 domain-containing protein n=1 Tax=Streptomyces sp. NPDC005077 TaxID=3154292 RepID=UPI0033A66746
MRQPDPDRDKAAVGGRPRAGLGRAGDWTLALGFTGGVGLTPSASTRTVIPSSNVGKPVQLFHRFDDSELRTAFE